MAAPPAKPGRLPQSGQHKGKTPQMWGSVRSAMHKMIALDYLVWREAHFEVKSVKTQQVRSTFGS